MGSSTRHGAYRDPLAGQRTQGERVLRRARKLGQRDRRKLPVTLRDELAGLETAARTILRRPPSTTDAIATFAELETTLAAAEELLGQQQPRPYKVWLGALALVSIFTLIGSASLASHRDDNCRQSVWCTFEGRCHSKGRTCVAESPEDCKAPCRSTGACVFNGSACIASNNRHCEQSEKCAEEGACSVDSGGGCLAARHQDCTHSAACQQESRCFSNGMSCVTAQVSLQHFDDCRLARACVRDGLCNTMPSCGKNTAHAVIRQD